MVAKILQRTADLDATQTPAASKGPIVDLLQTSGEYDGCERFAVIESVATDNL